MFKGNLQEVTTIKTSRGDLIEFLRKKRFNMQADFLRNGVTSLELAGKGIGVKGAKLIAEILKDNNFLTQLNLGGIGAEGLKLITEALKTNNTLTKLILSHNKIGYEGARLIAEALKANNSLTELNLFVNEIEDEGARLIAEALKANNSLTSLNLSFNKIGDTTILKTIDEYLQRNKTTVEKKAENLNAEGNDLCHQEKYSEAIEKYKAAIKISTKPLYKENKAKAEKKYEEQKQSLKLKQEASVTNNENNQLDIKDLPKAAEKQDTALVSLMALEEDIYDLLTKMIDKLENAGTINTNIIQNNILNKIQKLEKNQINLQNIANNIQSIMNSNKITRGMLVDLEDEIEKTIKQQAIINEGIRIDKLNIFKQIVEKVNINVENNISSNKAEMQNIINKIINEVSSLTNTYDIEKITASLKELTTGIVTRGKLVDVEDKLNEIILAQLNKNAVVTCAVKETIYDKPLLNHSKKLLQVAIDSKLLSPDLIYDAITNNDEELILAGLMSLEIYTPPAG